jgi:hypothetical protein
MVEPRLWLTIPRSSKPSMKNWRISVIRLSFLIVTYESSILDTIRSMTLDA